MLKIKIARNLVPSFLYRNVQHKIVTIIKLVKDFLDKVLLNAFNDREGYEAKFKAQMEYTTHESLSLSLSLAHTKETEHGSFKFFSEFLEKNQLKTGVLKLILKNLATL